MKLNLGCADRVLPASDGWLNVDLPEVIAALPKSPDYKLLGTYLDIQFPAADSSVDEVVAYDVFEHLPDRIKTMNELWRVLRPGGKATIETPNAAKGAGFWQDPTHITGWCMNSFQYFEVGSFAHKRLAKSYGIQAAFRILSLSEREYQDAHEKVWKITAVLEAVK